MQDDLEHEFSDELTSSRMTRLDLVKRAGILTAGLSAAGPFLASAARAAPLAAEAGSAVPAATVARLRSVLGLPKTIPGSNVTVQVGASFALSGPFTAYGTVMYRGAKLALEHLNALGGPKIRLLPRDNGLADVTKGVANVREWGNSGVPIVLTSGGGTNASEVPYYPQFKMVGLEGGGANPFNVGKPFFYQTRSQIPSDQIAGIMKYVKQKHPTFKKVLYLQLDYGAATTKSQEAAVKAGINAAGGFEYLPQIVAPVTTTDFSSVLSSIRESGADFVISAVYGGLAGILMKQYATSGLTAQIIGLDLTPDAMTVGGASMDAYEFAFDFFNATQPSNEWAKIFVAEHKRVNKGLLPDYYTANYYEMTFLVWDLIRKIIAAGGDPTKQGTAYVDALKKNRTFRSVYGGDGKRFGTKTLGAKTNSLVQVPMVYGGVSGGKVKVLASFNRRGADFKLR